jgi:hypothetical protein
MGHLRSSLLSDFVFVPELLLETLKFLPFAIICSRLTFSVKLNAHIYLIFGFKTRPNEVILGTTSAVRIVAATLTTNRIDAEV